LDLTPLPVPVLLNATVGSLALDSSDVNTVPPCAIAAGGLGGGLGGGGGTGAAYASVATP
jgi:hypothetical protein